MPIRWDDWVLDVDAHRLSGPHGPVHVEPQVFDVLVHLVEHRDRVVSKEELLDEIWGDQFVSESAVTSRIKSARRALGDDGRTQRYIRNVHGRGYQFVGTAEVESFGTPPATAPPGPLPAAVLDLALSIALDDEFPFVGRIDEMARIDATLRTPGLGLVLIGGEPGIGKSRLAVEVVTRSRRPDTVVCAGRCEPHAGSALQPIRDAMGQLAATDPTGFRAWAAGLEDQLLFLVPALVQHLSGAPDAVDAYSAIEVLLTVVDRASAARPLALVLDDLHLSDEPTRGFVSRLCRRFDERAVSIVCTFRTTALDLPPEVRHWIDERTRRSSAVRIDLTALDDDAARQLVAAVLGDERSGEADGLLSRTEGHGLFLTESLQRAGSPLPCSPAFADIDHRGTRTSPDQADARRRGEAYILAGPAEEVPWLVADGRRFRRSSP